METKMKNSEYGLIEEEIFKQSVEIYMGIPCLKTPREMDVYSHIDFIIGSISVDVKTHKKVNNSDRHLSNEYVWVELLTRQGRAGWINGNATHIVFSLTTHYVFIQRDLLKSLVYSNLYSNNLYPKDNNPRPYIKYRRGGLKEAVVLVPWKDVLDIPHFTIKRDTHGFEQNITG